MRRPLFYMICVVATFATIEAVPWYRRSKISETQSQKDDTADFGVEEFAVNSDGTKLKSGGGLRSQNEAEGVDDQGNNGYQVGRGVQDGRKTQGGRGPNGGRGSVGGNGFSENQDERGDQNNGDDSSRGLTPDNQNGNENQYGGEGGVEYNGNGYQGGYGSQDGFSQSSGGRGIPTGRDNRRNQYGDRDLESSDEDDSDEHPYTRSKSSRGCKRCRLMNIGNGSSNKNSVYFHES